MNMFNFCRVESRHGQSDGVAGQFILMQKKELNNSSTVVYLFYCTGSFTCCQV